MARFSLGGEEDDADEAPDPSSSSPTPKRLKLTITPPGQRPPSPADGQVEASVSIQEEELDAVEEEESEYEIEAEEEESEYEEEDDDEQDGEELFESHFFQRERPQIEPIEDPNRDGPISVTLTDPDVLDCPICLEPLSIPVFQCENGHTACSSCCIKIGNKCPSCSWPIGYNRCRAMEKVLESVKLLCKNKKYGCKQMVKYSSKHEHENACIHAPCSCPIVHCNYVGIFGKLYSHFSLEHSASAKAFHFNKRFTFSLEKSQRYLILRETDTTIIFVLQHFSERHGGAINVVCIQPSSIARCFYDLIVRDGDTSIKLRSSVESIPKWVDTPPAKKFLLVPNHYYTSTCGQLKLDIRIWDHRPSPIIS